jgi:hypothetical protein
MKYTKHLDAQNKRHGLGAALTALGLLPFLGGLLTSLATWLVH